MKLKKLWMPSMIFVAAVLAMLVYSLFTSVAKKPTITEKEFAFSITYELDGKEVTIKDVYLARYVGNSGYTDTKSCIYTGKIGGLQEGTTEYILKEGKNTRIVLLTNFYADYEIFKQWANLDYVTLIGIVYTYSMPGSYFDNV